LLHGQVGGGGAVQEFVHVRGGIGPGMAAAPNGWRGV
jgi:hypothetical protein